MGSHVKRTSYSFDGHGNFVSKEWDLHSPPPPPQSEGFSWYHVELPRSTSRLCVAAQYLIKVLCPPLKLQDILSLVSNGPFCGYVEGALIFRVNSAGPSASDYTHRLAVRVTSHSVITVSLGRIPRLGFSTSSSRSSLLMEVPSLEPKFGHGDDLEDPSRAPGMAYPAFVIPEHMVEFLLTMNHSEGADNPVPTCIPDLLIHVIDTHVDQLQDIITSLEIDLDEVELELEDGSFVMKQKMLNDRLFPKMHLDLQRLLQVIAHGEQVFPRVRDKSAGKTWLMADNIVSLDTLVGRLQKLKENLGFLANRITALQAGLSSWQSEQINRKLYYLSFLSIIFLPLSIVTAVFGMNVGGIPWTDQKATTGSNGFRNVLMLCAVILMLLFACFWTVPLYTYIKTRQLKQVVRQKWHNTKKSIRWRGTPQNSLWCNGYFRL